MAQTRTEGPDRQTPSGPSGCPDADAVAAHRAALDLPIRDSRTRRFVGRHPRFVDGIVVGIYAGFNALLLTFVGVIAVVSNMTQDLVPTGSPLSVGGYIALETVHVIVVSIALWIRRSRTLLSFNIIFAMCAISATVGVGVDIIALPLAAYALSAYRPRRQSRWGLLASIVLVLVSTFIFTGPLSANLVTDDEISATSSFLGNLFSATLLIVFQLTPVVLCYSYGRTVRNRRNYVTALIDRAEALATERDQQALIAAQAERARIAREMHDVVAHSLTVMVALADGADASIDRAPDSAHLALNRLTETGRSALSEMRRLLGVLNSGADDDAPPAELTPQPTGEMIDDLVAQFRLAGLPVRLTRSGVLPDDTGVGLTVFRIVQEGLTNALRYANEPTIVEVSITATDSEITVTVRDDGRGAPRPGVGAGRGLVGMQERAAVFEGNVTAGPDHGIGWKLVATLHTEGSS